MTPVVVRLYYQMHYGQMAVLSAMGLVACVVPLAVLACAGAFLFARILPTGPYPPHRIALSVSAALVAVVTLANVVGSMLPFFFKRVGLDPAVTSGPFIASVMDVTAIVIYFSIAISILGMA